ncbi:hypothetical protein BDQ17DRAFT_1356845 [Cyathus striatus]|nr:hypothetical protein BDQ17DRAFT_1356845 [Cyathus striatus]
MPDHKCKYCEEPATKRCSGCSKVWYCGSRCQKLHWDSHIFDCNPRCPINTAHHLAHAARHHIRPEDQQTLDDFGFSKAFTSHNMSMLMGLYIGLICVIEIPSKSLHKWRIEGRLIPEIKAAYSKIPVNNRGEYYAWFLKNQWILDNSIPAPGDPMLDMFRRGWEYAGGEGAVNSAEEGKSAIDTGHLNDAHASSFLHPNPIQPEWINFGFCTCKQLEEEVRLGGCYRMLLHNCTFNEFCDAFINATLFQQLKFFGVSKDLPPHLEDFLRSRLMRYSVWDLKQFVVADGSQVEPAMSITVDYGLINCKNDDDKNELKAVYNAYFSASNGDPVTLHQACIQGKLFDHVGSVVKKLPKKFKKLMRNMYPLPNY